MRYFGGLGAGKGWHKFKFILTPEEMEILYSSLAGHFVKTNSRVPIGYDKTSNEEFLTAYRFFFEQVLISSTSLNRKEEWVLEAPVRLSIIDDMSKISFEDITDKRGNISKEFKMVAVSEPVINIAPFYLHLSEDKKLSVAYMHEEGTIGLELTYPKVFSTKDDDFSVIYDTAEMATGKLFHELVARTKKLTHKAKVIHGASLYKPDFWISNDAAKQIKGNKFLKTNRLVVN